MTNLYDTTSGLSAKEQLIAIAKEEFGISYGLRFTLPEDVPHSIKAIGSLKVRDYAETPSGETILRTLAVRANDAMVEKQNSFMFETAADLFSEFPEAFEDFEEAYGSLSKVPEKAMKSPQLILRYRDIQRQASQQVSSYVEQMRLVSDLIFCYFLTLHTEKEWELEDLYALGADTKEAISEFMAEQIGLKTLEDEDEDETPPSAEDAEEAGVSNKPTGGKSPGSKAS